MEPYVLEIIVKIIGSVLAGIVAWSVWVTTLLFSLKTAVALNEKHDSDIDESFSNIEKEFKVQGDKIQKMNVNIELILQHLKIKK